MNPDFELDQILRYIDHLSGDPKQLQVTAATHFFPVLQRIFIHEGFEAIKEPEFRDRTFAFLLKDLDLKRAPVAVDFGFQVKEGNAHIPTYAYDWDSAQGSHDEASLLILRNAKATSEVLSNLYQSTQRVRFLDFQDLKSYATQAFKEGAERKQSRAIAIVTDMIEALISAIAAKEMTLEKIEWFDLERLFFQTLNGLGYKAHHTPLSKDGGRDILACDIQIDDVHWYAIEIKHWRGSKPGATHIEPFLETSLREGRHGALFVSTSGVRDSGVAIRTEMQSDYLRFADGDRIVKSCEHYMWAKTGLWTPHNSLRSFLFSETT